MITQVPHTQLKSRNITQMLQHQLQSSRYGNKVQSINMSLLKHLQGDMLNDRLQVAKEERPFKLKCTEEMGNKLDRTDIEMSHLVSKRQYIENELKKLQHEEHKLYVNHSRFGLAQSKLSQSIVSSSPDRILRSQLTEQQKNKIQSVLKAQKKFIKQLKLKENEYYEELENDRKKNIQAEENLKKEKCQQRKVYWERVRSEIAKKQESRKKNFVEDQANLEEIKNSKKLYEVLEDSWNNIVAKDEELIKQATQHMRQNHKFDLTKIVQHQKKHQRLAKDKEEARQQSVDDFNNRMKLTLPKIPSSKFFVALKQQEKKKKQEEQEKEKKRFELSQKMYEFSKRVKEDYKPKIDETAKQILQISIQEDKLDKKASLLLGQVQNLGNNYMREVHKNVALVRAARGSVSKVQEKLQEKKPQHKNYLKELKEKRKNQGTTMNLTDEVSKIMKNTAYSTVQKMQRAKLVAKRLDGKQNTNSSALIKNINEKMKILKALNQN